MEKIGKRLEGWSKALLSCEGRYTLVKSVLNGIPIYVLSLFKIPAKVAKALEKLMRDFLWREREIIW